MNLALRTFIITGLLWSCFLHPHRTLSAEPVLSDSEKVTLFSEANSFFSQANELAQAEPAQAKELYQKSLLRYERLVDAGVRNGRLYYNIGNGYFRLEDIGRALLNYRRAELYIPTDPNLKQNLSYVLDQRRDKIEAKQKVKVLKTLFFWHYDIPADVRSLLLGIFYGAFWVVAVIRIFSAKPWLNWGLGFSLAFFLLFSGSLWVDHYYQSKNRNGVLIAAETIARKGDGRTYQPSFENPLHAGTEFNLLEERENWLFIELQDGRRTWVPERSAQLVKP